MSNATHVYGAVKHRGKRNRQEGKRLITRTTHELHAAQKEQEQKSQEATAQH